MPKLFSVEVVYSGSTELVILAEDEADAKSTAEWHDFDPWDFDTEVHCIDEVADGDDLSRLGIENDAFPVLSLKYKDFEEQTVDWWLEFLNDPKIRRLELARKATMPLPFPGQEND